MTPRMSSILFRRFLARPMQVAYVLPSSKKLVARVLDHLDFGKIQTFVEFGGGEGCYTREIAKRLSSDGRLFVFELDPHLAEHLRKQFRDDARVIICESDAALFRDELHKHGIAQADCVISGIPFSYIPPRKKKEILHAVHEGLAEDGLFVVYQVTPELKGHARMFVACEVEYCIASIPPMFILTFHKAETTVKSKPRKKAKRSRATAKVS